MSRNPEYALSTCSRVKANLILRYVKAVIRSYIEVKQARGRTGQQISWKLELLEREVCHSSYAYSTTKFSSLNTLIHSLLFAQKSDYPDQGF